MNTHEVRKRASRAAWLRALTTIVGPGGWQFDDWLRAQTRR